MKLHPTADSVFSNPAHPSSSLWRFQYQTIVNNSMTESAQVIGRKSNCVQSKEVVPVEGKMG